MALPSLRCNGQQPSWTNYRQVGSDGLLIRVICVTATPRVVTPDQGRGAHKVCRGQLDSLCLARADFLQTGAQLVEQRVRLYRAKGDEEAREVAEVSWDNTHTHSIVCVLTRTTVEGNVPAVVFLQCQIKYFQRPHKNSWNVYSSPLCSPSIFHSRFSFSVPTSPPTRPHLWPLRYISSPRKVALPRSKAPHSSATLVCVTFRMSSEGLAGGFVPYSSRMVSCSASNALRALLSASRSRVTVIVKMDPGPSGGSFGPGWGISSEGNSRRCAFGPSRVACG